ncbi:MAG: baseplate J/gp47 family protein [Nitrosarchaeum sp.]|nr:baseplate J/gp47 family protein [Nitrosarchaeum sp.]
MARPSQPTGLSTIASNNSIVISWYANSEPDIKGYNIYNSTTSGSGTSGYVKLNNELITDISEVKTAADNPIETVTIVGSTKTTTVVETIVNINIYAYTHIDLLEDKPQYYVITAVNNTDEESQYSIEVSDTPLVLTTAIIDFPVRSTNDVTQSMITNILARQPKIDVKPGTMTRDVHIDPHASEFGSLYIYLDFLYRSESFLTLIAIDDPNNTGTSIAVVDSTYKQQLKTAMQLDSDDAVQQVIDFAFDKLAGDFKVFRNAAISSTGQVVFYTITQPLATITIPSGTIISTTATSAKPAINFKTITEAKMLIASISQYFNVATQRYELIVPVQSIETGEITNVSAGTIINSTFSQLRVTNTTPTYNGNDEESNTHLASRAMLAFTGLDVGMINGYLKTAVNTQYVEDVLVVDAGHVLMQRDYDEVRHKHVFGKVDIFFKGNVETTYNETFGFLFKGNIRENMNIVSTTDMRVSITNSDVSANYPVYLIHEIINVTNAESYDLLGDFTLYKNAIEIAKSAYTLNLTTGDLEFAALLTGDSLTADYLYKIPVTGEVVVAAAVGGETIAFLDQPSIFSKPVVALTDIIYINRISFFSVDPFTDILTILPRSIYHTGDTIQVSAVTTLPSPLIAGTTYYVIAVSSPLNTDIKLATTLANAQAGIAIDIINSGVGSLTIQPVTATPLVRDTDYTINNTSGLITFTFASFPTGLLASDVITADYEYVETVTGEVIIASAAGGETTAAIANGNVKESFTIESDGKTINLDETNVINASIGMAITDVIRITYKYRKTDNVVLTNQPVDSINSVSIGLTSLVEGTNYQFVKADDLLLDGNSVRAVRYLRIIYDSTSNLPAGVLTDISDQINLVGREYKPFSEKGVDINTIVVTNLTQTITYVLNNDYVLLNPETPFDYLQIARSTTTTIADGQTVLVSYQHGEAITVSYNVNSLIKIIQDKVNIERHVTADVLVKGANQFDVDLEFTVKLMAGVSSPVTKDELATDLTLYFNQQKLGSRVNQSDVIRIIDSNHNVDYIIMPLTRMAVSDGTQVAYELLPINTTWSVYQTGTVSSYKTITGILVYNTAGNISDDTKFWRVSVNDEELVLVNSKDDVKNAAGQGFIDSDGTIYVSTFDSSDPANHNISVAYVVSGEIGSNDIVVTDLDYLNLKSLIIHTV